MITKWIFVILLGLSAHFSASYLIPLDEASKKTFLGLLKWVWPWAYGDHGLLGKISQSEGGFPIAGFFIAVTSAGLLILALLGILHWWIPFGWWKFLAISGASLSIILMISFFGPTKIIPILLAIFILYLALSDTPLLNLPK